MAVTLHPPFINGLQSDRSRGLSTRLGMYIFTMQGLRKKPYLEGHQQKQPRNTIGHLKGNGWSPGLE